MPVYGGTPILTDSKAQQMFAMIKGELTKAIPDSAERALLQEPGVQCNGWCVTLETEALDFWPGWLLDRIGDDLRAAGVFAEPVSHCHLGLYPA